MEKNIASIYRITNTLNNKVYIGFDSCYPKRIKQHFNDAKRGVISPLCEDIRNYGWENFTKEVIYQSLDFTHCLKNMENYFIIQHNSHTIGYNRTLGGNGTLKSPRPKSSEWRKKHSERMKNNNPRKGYTYTKEERERQSVLMKDFYQKNPNKLLIGDKNPMYGKKHDEEWKKNHSDKMKENKTSIKAMTVKKPCNKCGYITTLGNLARYHNENCTRNI